MSVFDKQQCHALAIKSIFVGGVLVTFTAAPALQAFADTIKYEEKHSESTLYHSRWKDEDKDWTKHHTKNRSGEKGRGYHKKAQVRKDFGAVRTARKEVQDDRKELHSDYQELRKDRAELRRDIRNGASQKEIRQDREELR